MKLGAAIRYTRERLGLKLEAVAFDAGFDAGNLSRIETGKQQPSVNRLEHIAQAMNVRVSEIYALAENATASTLRDGDGTPYPLVHDDFRMIQRGCATLDTRNRKLVLEFVKMLNRLQRA